MRETFSRGDWSDWFPAPGKLNLMLRITGRRPDGYHQLQTVFQFIDLCDRLRFRKRNDQRVVRSSPLDGVSQEEDLVVRAAELLSSESGVSFGVDIELDKRLPMGGGVGGGSSDAATVLMVLNELLSLGCSREKLKQLGRTLGADVPVFVGGVAAWAEGVGELLTPIEPEQSWYLLAAPDCHVSTAAVFSHPDLTRDSYPIKIESFLSGLERGNDCRQIVARLYSEVSKAIGFLTGFGEVRLTGTGACLFVPFVSRNLADKAAASVGGKVRCFVVKGENRSPLLDALGLDK